MMDRGPHLLTSMLVVLLVAVACRADEPSASSEPDTAALAVAHAPPCSEAAGSDIPEWPTVAEGESRFLPVVMSSLLSAGPNRFLYNVLDLSYRQLAAPDVASSVDFYAIERDPAQPVASVEAAYLSSGLGRGLYRAPVEFDCVGEWGAEVAVELEDGSWATERMRFAVHPLGTTPAIGEPVPRSESPTAGTLGEAALVSTDRHPYLAAYDKTVAETVTSGRPSLVFFATPQFCQTGYCGPTVELVKSVAREHEGRVEFVNVEPYELEASEAGLQPRLDADGQLQPVAAAVDYGIPVEPYLFLVDADGRAFAKFEGIVGGDELRAAIEDVLAA